MVTCGTLLNRKEAIIILRDKPFLFANAVGFNKMSELHNNWIRDMVLGNDDKTLQAHRG